MSDPAPPDGTSSSSNRRILTVPNLISFARIATIPLFFSLIVDEDTTKAGLILFGVVAATDWVDGVVARATGQVSEFGKVLDPVADRLAIAAGLIALVVRDAFPLWAALLILVRDVAILVAGLVLLVCRDARIEVRYLGKVATFGLMMSIGFISWGTLGFAFAPAALACGWAVYTVAIVESYVTAALYVGDLRAAWAALPPAT
ncbi:MAG TPA: CDP-alcohol phosphatidyltransferase family protein [Actinomycetota bacterium]|nr:CDP-alcohol phosphatidyltransferase family protein [Actinomycetota bacterium]